MKQAVFLFLSLMTIVTAYDPDWALHPKIRDGPIRILHGITRYIGIIALFVGLSSCESLYEDGEWQKMELDKSGLYFNSFGGEEVVRVLNYESWRIAGGYEATEYIDGNLIYKNYVYPQSTDGESGNANDLLDGGWYRVTVPHKGECRKAVITVDQNLLTRPRQATVQMQSGNSFTNIIIYQP